MADVVVPVVNLAYTPANQTQNANAADLTSPAAITDGQTFEIDVDGLSDKVVLLFDHTDSAATTLTFDQPSPNGFSGENQAQTVVTTAAAAGQFGTGPFETARFKFNVNAGADAGKITGTLANASLANGTLIAVALPKGVG